MNPYELVFSYLGERDYLDVTSILESFWQVMGQDTRKKIRDMDFRILAPFNENCSLYYQKGSFAAVPKDPCAKFSWKIDGEKYFGLLVPNGNKITLRIPEPKWDFEHYCDFNEGVMRLKTKFKQDTCYSLTKMGKYLISKYRDPNVKVVRFNFKELLSPDDLEGTCLRLENMVGGDFIKVICEKNNEEFGFIVVTTKAQ